VKIRAKGYYAAQENRGGEIEVVWYKDGHFYRPRYNGIWEENQFFWISPEQVTLPEPHIPLTDELYYVIDPDDKQCYDQGPIVVQYGHGHFWRGYNQVTGTPLSYGFSADEIIKLRPTHHAPSK
jgi:hypothetical protein